MELYFIVAQSAKESGLHSLSNRDTYLVFKNVRKAFPF